MSVPEEENVEPNGAPEGEGLVLPADPAAAGMAILELLAPSSVSEEDGAEAGAADAPEDGDGSGAAPAQGVGAADGAPGAPAAGDGGVEGVPADGADPDVARGVIDASSLSDAWGQLTEKFETSQREHFEGAAWAEMETEYARYIDALRQHPRVLVGQEVPSLQGEGMETLRDSADAAEWQAAVKSLLNEELTSRAQSALEDAGGIMSTIHQSIDVLRNNPDLVPGTKQFDRGLADAVASLIEPYEIRNNKKLIGWSVDVQPLIAQLRTQRAAQAAAAAVKAAPAVAGAPETSARAAKAAEQPRDAAGRFDGPQAGLLSKAGGGAPVDESGADVLGAFLSQNGFRI